mgnify:CR=1 FL=1
MHHNFKNFAPSCERNQTYILSVLQQYLQGRKTVLEIGSYSGQHALYLTKCLPSLVWQPTDIKRYIGDLSENLEPHLSEQLLSPKLLDVSHSGSWSSQNYDVMFTANTLHIMSWSSVIAFFSLAARVMKLSGMLFIYGPFNYHGEFTAPSNAEFDVWLKVRDAESGIRDFEAIQAQAMLNGLSVVEDISMPANNRMLIIKKHS